MNARINGHPCEMWCGDGTWSCSQLSHEYCHGDTVTGVLLPWWWNPSDKWCPSRASPCVCNMPLTPWWQRSEVVCRTLAKMSLTMKDPLKLHYRYICPWSSSDVNTIRHGGRTQTDPPPAVCQPYYYNKVSASVFLVGKFGGQNFKTLSHNWNYNPIELLRQDINRLHVHVHVCACDVTQGDI